jgi:hypothetical protein
MIKEKDSSRTCDSCRKRNSLKPHHVAVQTDDVKDENFLMPGNGGSEIIRVCILLKMESMSYVLSDLHKFYINLGATMKD